MFDVLVILALIPLALVGAMIAVRLGWLIAPYALLGLGGFFFLVFKDESSATPAKASLAVAGLGLCWAIGRWTK